jgi:PAS domain S-box-containing protein
MREARTGSWQERDIEELRAREANYRERLAHQAALAERLQGYSLSLQRMLRGRPPSRAHLSSTLLEVAKLSSLALDIERTSVWLFDASREHLHCSIQLIGQVEEPGVRVSIASASCPTYVSALGESHALAVEEVYNDPRTGELTGYLRERGIGALLDIPVVVPGGLLGVVCHEHVGGPRVWQREEIDFAANVGSLVALALETERRLTAEHMAYGSEAKYRHLVESLPVTVYAFDTHTGKLEYLSPRAFELGGWPAEQWLAAGIDSWIQRIHAEDRPGVLARFQPGAVRGFPPELTYRVHLPDGQLRWVRDTCSLVRDQLGRALALQGVLCDVTLQIEADLERKELERRHRFMLDHADLHAVMLDADARITFVNDYFCRTTGFERLAIVGRNWFELTTPVAERPRLQAEFYQGIERGDLAPRMDGPLHTAAGEKRHVLWTNTLLRHTDGVIHGVSGLGVDLTQRLRLETELQQQTKLESLGRLAAGVAHDFNNLLTVMLSETERLGMFFNGATTAGALTIEAARVSQQALSDALRQAAELTHSLLVYGRKEPVSQEAVPVDELVQETLRLAAAVAGPELETSSSLQCHDARVLLDRAQLRQVILNLVGNAADATRGLGTTIYIGTHLELVDTSVVRRYGGTQGGEFVVLTVADDGRGMDERTLARIFDPFFTTKSDGRGTGLGLAMCQSIVNRARGFIDVQSSQGAGTRFRIYLPNASFGAAAAERTPLETGPVPSAQPHQHTRILVVDDVPSIRNVLVSCLRDAGYHVYEAASVASAAQVLASQPVDLLLTDGSLPDGSGFVLARSARKAQPELKVVLVSGSFESDEGFDAVMLKPFETAQLLRLVAELMSPGAPLTAA